MTVNQMQKYLCMRTYVTYLTLMKRGYVVILPNEKFNSPRGPFFPMVDISNFFAIFFL